MITILGWLIVGVMSAGDIDPPNDPPQENSQVSQPDGPSSKRPERRAGGKGE